MPFLRCSSMQKVRSQRFMVTEIIPAPLTTPLRVRRENSWFSAEFSAVLACHSHWSRCRVSKEVTDGTFFR